MTPSPARSSFATLFVALPALGFLPFVLLPPFNQDVAAVLDFSQRWLAGERLYADMIDVNPPLIFILNLGPALLARWTGVSPIAAFQLAMLVLGALVAWLCRRVVRPRGPGEAAFLGAMPVLVLLAPGTDFGQRDPLMLLLALPYLLQASARAEGTPAGPRIAVALLAGIGFALKPYFAAIPLLVEAYVLLRRRRLDASVATLAAVAAAYGAVVLLLFPDYLSRAVPISVEAYLGFADDATVPLLLGQRLAKILLVLIAASVLAWGTGERVRVLILAAFGGVIAAIVQHKGWSYHVVPVELLTLALSGLAVIKLLDRLGYTRPLRAAAILMGLSCVYLVSNGETPWAQWRHGRSPEAALGAAIERHAAGGRVLGLIGPIAPLFPALTYAGATSTLPVMDLWPLDAVYRECPQLGAARWVAPERMARPESFLYRHVVEGFAADPPDAVVVDTHPPIVECDGPFDLIGYFSRDPGFARTFAGYRLAERIGRFAIHVRIRP